LSNTEVAVHAELLSCMTKCGIHCSARQIQVWKNTSFRLFEMNHPIFSRSLHARCSWNARQQMKAAATDLLQTFKNGQAWKRQIVPVLWAAYEYFTSRKSSPKTSNCASVTKKDYIDALTPIMLRETEPSLHWLYRYCHVIFGPLSQPMLTIPPKLHCFHR
jgi:hypothetical protein